MLVLQNNEMIGWKDAVADLGKGRVGHSPY